MYECCELVDVCWIAGVSNPADVMTKATPNKAIKELINNNQLTVNVKGWVIYRE